MWHNVNILVKTVVLTTWAPKSVYWLLLCYFNTKNLLPMYLGVPLYVAQCECSFQDSCFDILNKSVY